MLEVNAKVISNGEIKETDKDYIRMSVFELMGAGVIRTENGIKIFDQDLFIKLYGKDAK